MSDSFRCRVTPRNVSFLVGSGTGRHGGGRIWLEANVITILGSVYANGEDANYIGAGGSGGSIIMRSKEIIIDRRRIAFLSRLEDAHVTAIGGTGNPDTDGAPNWGYAAGGGGRVLLRYELLNCANYDAISA